MDSLRADGGAAQNNWLLQFQADLLGMPVERPALVETTALGAAALAGYTAEVWPALDTLAAGEERVRFLPGDGQAAARTGWQEWKRAVGAALDWARADIPKTR